MKKNIDMSKHRVKGFIPYEAEARRESRTKPRTCSASCFVRGEPSRLRSGFTLIELIVGVFIFSILIVLAGGSFVSSLELQRRALDLKRVEENARFVLELMTRELRVANPINTADTACPASGISSLSFTHPVNGGIEYFLSGTEVHRRVDGVDSVISNPDVEVTRLTFCVSGNSLADDRQPRVSIILGLKAEGSTNNPADALDVQTTVSQRVLID